MDYLSYDYEPAVEEAAGGELDARRMNHDDLCAFMSEFIVPDDYERDYVGEEDSEEWWGGH